MKNKEILKLLVIPLSLFAISLSMLVAWKIIGLPEGQELADIVTRFFQKGGLWIIFVSAIFEGFLIVGQYYPGAIVIFLGVIAAGGDPLETVKVVSVVSLSFFIAYTLNYLVGRYGWYRLFLKFGLARPLESAKAKLAKQHWTAIIGTYWQPNLASITATAAGVLQLPLMKFLPASLAGIVIWNTVWGTMVAVLGTAALRLMSVWVAIPVALAWMGIILLKYELDKRKATN